MGVMACYRDECGNIMCKRYSREHGYICNECFNELRDIGFWVHIEDFMHTPKRLRTYDQTNKSQWELLLNNTFKLEGE